MTKNRNLKICIIAIGNPIRCDDGVAAFIVEQLEKRLSNSFAAFTTQQLDIAWAEKIKDFDFVFFIDASVYEEDFFLKEIDGEGLPQSSSHHINVSALVRFTQQLYQAKTIFFLCGIKGHNFDFGFSLSEQTKNYAFLAIELLNNKIVALVTGE